jgi:hypothetical protein
MSQNPMNDFSIAGTQSTPEIRSDWEGGVLVMQGNSYPENSYELFSEIVEWIERFFREEDRPLNLDLHLLYLNTSSVKAMMDIFDVLEAAWTEGKKVSVNWHYDKRNERVAELAEEFKEDCSFPFDILGS